MVGEYLLFVYARPLWALPGYSKKVIVDTMEDYLAPLILFVVLFVGFGLSQRGKQSSGGCVGCTGSCSSQSECKNEGDTSHH